MKKIITISREFGSGGGTIGKMVAERLGYEYYDKDLIFKTAAEANMSPEEAIKLDETLSRGFGFGQSLFNLYSSPLDEKLYNAQKNIIRKFAEKGNCVIVGRNANSCRIRQYPSRIYQRKSRMARTLPQSRQNEGYE
jgi:cytidylate kinase